jgi:signal peptidase I
MKKFLNKETIKELRSIIYVIILALAIRTFIFEPYHIPSTSMYDNLQIGDYLIGTKYNYGYSNKSIPYSPNLFSGRIFSVEPKRGDVIIFKAKNTGIDERFIKRLIGLPGDKVKITNGDLYINDIKIQKQYVEDIKDEKGNVFGKFIEVLPEGKQYNILRLKTNDTDYEQGYANNIPDFYVPEGHYFFLGDNRDHSADSRFQMGFVENQELIAKAQLIFFSTSTKLWIDNGSIIEQISNIWPWLQSIQFHRIFNNLS